MFTIDFVEVVVKGSRYLMWLEQFGHDVRPDAKPLSNPAKIHDKALESLGSSIHAPPRNRAQEAQSVILEETSSKSRTMATITPARFATTLNKIE